MKILITGGAGFIASHVADAYLEAGHKVAIVDNLSTGQLRNLNPKATFYQMDICDPAIGQVFEAEQPDIVNHHAAQASVPLSIANPLYDAEVNVKGVINVLENCVKYKLKKVIYISSGGAMYGEAEETPTTETYPPKPLSVYAIHKLMGERYLDYYHHQYGLDFTVLRYANVYGPRQVAHGEAGVVSLFVEMLLSGKTPTICKYADQPRGMIRDYVFVGDVVRANLAVLSKGDNQAFNIGTCVTTHTEDLYNEIDKQLHTNITPTFSDARKGDLRVSLLDISKASAILDWEPKTNLKDGLEQVIDYFKDIHSKG
ncbi:MAG: NAD-dependent epimerase/dehydratase family protein [Candidatus Cloacimonetes bacterium]|nr:NAD-dependent epimerase/dehydratase family protein [Candidatus Cloacimonadota bacterium]